MAEDKTLTEAIIDALDKGAHVQDLEVLTNGPTTAAPSWIRVRHSQFVTSGTAYLVNWPRLGRELRIPTNTGWNAMYAPVPRWNPLSQNEL